ncbi:hypothetical protein [Desulfobacter postgatei]|uniref:hypothetical protein n=1 Tax=Desulfobacter postgatei TaxID=2293 RepID=UPI00259B713D|nr:hypothetical protein [uncultured Desulfobacter sp.]
MSKPDGVIIGDDTPENYKQESADKGATETAGKASQEGEKEEPAKEERLYAGKFKTPEDMEKSYAELEAKQGQIGNEVGTLRKERETLLSLLEKQQQAPDATKEEKQEAEDLTAKLQEISQKVEDGDLTIAEGMLQTSQITQQIATKNTLASMESMQQQKALEGSRAKFAEDNPDFFEMLQSGALKEVKDQLPVFHDDISAFYAKKAFDAQSNLAAAVDAARKEGFEAGKAEMAKIADGDSNTRKVLQKPGETAKNIGTKKTGSYSQNEMRQSGLAALQAVRGG